MAKYYVKCGSLELIYSCDKCPRDAAMDTIWETNEFDVLGEFFFIDERGFRDESTADGFTCKLHTSHIMKDAGWSL